MDAIVRNFEIIGEATKHIPMEVKAEHPMISRPKTGSAVSKGQEQAKK
jgi:uncharacterized protein with HEPN domain